MNMGLIKRPTYEIVNLVSTGSLDLSLDLYRLAFKLKNIEYEPEQFPGAILRINNPKCAMLIFKNGKMNVVGCRDEETMKKAIKTVFKMIAPYSITPPPKRYKPKYRITNIVASGDLGVSLDLYRLAAKLKNVEYEPEQFPGAIMKLEDPKASLLLFKNGKVIIQCDREEDIKKTLKKVAKILEPFASPREK